MSHKGEYLGPFVPKNMDQQYNGFRSLQQIVAAEAKEAANRQDEENRLKWIKFKSTLEGYIKKHENEQAFLLHGYHPWILQIRKIKADLVNVEIKDQEINNYEENFGRPANPWDKTENSLGLRHSRANALLSMRKRMKQIYNFEGVNEDGQPIFAGRNSGGH